MEQGHIEQRTTDLYTRLKKERGNDNAQMGIGLVLFWPALFFLEGGDGPEASEYANMKGQYEALRKVSIDKECGLEFRDKLSSVAAKDPKATETKASPPTASGATSNASETETPPAIPGAD